VGVSAGRPGLADVVEGGDRRESLVALRDHLARAIQASDGHGTAALAKQLLEVMREIDGLPAVKESAFDQLAARRKAARGSEAAS
jgi:hypothetical protein